MSQRTKSQTYRSWEAMLRRCRVEIDPAYKNYGGRGIGVCDRWISYDAFEADMGLCPPGLTIDRIDVSLGYSPENCRWATRMQQGENRRSNNYVEVDGVKVHQAEAARLKGISPKLLHYRLKAGWGLAEALDTMPGGKLKKSGPQRLSVYHIYKGVEYHQADLARLAGISPGLMYARLKAGWSVEKAVITPTRSNGK